MPTQRLLALVCLSIALASSLVTGCSATTQADDAVAAPAAGMGGAMGSGAESNGMVEGVVAHSSTAALAPGDVHGTESGVFVDKVTAPAKGWLVVHSAIPPYPAMGATAIPAGTSSGHSIALSAADGTNAFVALHVDRGTPGEFEFDYARPRQSPDTMVYVDRKPVQAPVRLDGFGVNLLANSALLLVKDQRVRGGELLVDYALLPEASWISVNVIEKGLPGKRIGLVARPAGEQQSVRVPLTSAVDPGDELVVTVHADRGAPGRFDFDAGDPFGGSDQPYVAAGVIVSQRILAE